MKAAARHCSAAVGLAGWLCLAAGQDTDLNGHVTDQAGTPVADATVALLGKGLWVTTAADGSFHLDKSSPVVVEQSSQRATGPRLAFGTLHFNVGPGAAPVRVDVFDAAGRVLATPVRERLAPGAYQADPLAAVSARQLCFVRLQVGGEAHVFKALPGAAGGPTRARSTGSSDAAAGMAKSTAGEVDWLAVTKPGYTPRTVGITSYTQTIDIQLQKRVRFSFSVNRGTNTVTVRPCTLFVVDSAQAIAGLRFTQKASGTTPLFDSVDADNPVRTASPTSETTALAWVLADGGGAKRVFAEVAWKDTAKGLDTISTEATIAPWRVNVVLANLRQTAWVDTAGVERRDGPDSASMVLVREDMGFETRVYDNYVFGVPRVEYRLDLGGDSTFADSFDVRLVATNLVSGLANGSPTDTTTWWQELPAMRQALTGVGEGHDTAHVYTYAFDTLSAAGRQNLSQVRRISQPSAYPYVAYVDTVTGTPESIFSRVTQRTRPQAAARGVKEFMMALHMRGRSFGEDRWYVSTVPDTQVQASMGTAMPRQVFRLLYMCFWPPRAAQPWPGSSGYLQNGDTVGAAFDLALTGVFGGPVVNYSVNSMSFAQVTRADLVVARKPAGLAWDYRTWGDATIPPITLSEFLALPHESFAGADTTVAAKWYRVSTAGWPSGEYLLGIITADQFGNQGFAPLPFDPVRHTTNPFVVTVLSGS